jgi:hypothetical protein
MEDASAAVVLRVRGVTWVLMDHSGWIAIQTGAASAQLHTPMLLPFGFTAVHVPIVHSDCCSQTVSSPAAHVAADLVPENFERKAPQVSVPPPPTRRSWSRYGRSVSAPRCAFR